MLGVRGMWRPYNNSNIIDTGTLLCLAFCERKDQGYFSVQNGILSKLTQETWSGISMQYYDIKNCHRHRAQDTTNTVVIHLFQPKDMKNTV